MHISFGKSKLARQFAFLFIACAFIPTLILIMFSYERVVDQMTQQSVTKLVKETKTYGLSLFDRLVRVSDQLLYLSRVLEIEGIGSGKLVESIRPESFDLFNGIFLLLDNGHTVGLLGGSKIPDVDLLKEQYLKTSAPVGVFSSKSNYGPADVYLYHRVDIQNMENVLIVANINASHLWGVGLVPLLPPSTELAVYNENGTILISTYGAPGNRLDTITPMNSEKNLRSFEYYQGGEKYFAGLWSLFLKSRFGSGTWTIVLSQSEEYILSALKDFKGNLIRVVTIGLLVILLLSISLIRKRLAPLDKLKVRTMQIAQQDFTSEVEIKSGDEFEELADSFNVMSYQLHRQFSALETIEKIDRAILSSLKFNDIIRATLPMIRDFFGSDIVIFGRLINPSSNYLKGYILQSGVVEPNVQYLNLRNYDYDRVFGATEPVGWKEDHHFLDNVPELKTGNYKRFYAVTLQKEQINTGVLILAYKQNRIWKDNELTQLRQLADQISIALSNSELVENLEKLASGTIEALARTVDAKSKWTMGHSERVSVLAGGIGETMGLPNGQIEILNRAGLLHDIGKIGIPLTILDKPGKLSNDEFKEIKSHPEIGAKILEPIEVYQNIIPAIMQHHERYDGKGYPWGLAGKDIDINGRILAVADVFDALSSNRPYRDGWVLEQALGFMNENAGTLFDPEIIEAFRATIVEQ